MEGPLFYSTDIVGAFDERYRLCSAWLIALKGSPRVVEDSFG